MEGYIQRVGEAQKIDILVMTVEADCTPLKNGSKFVTRDIRQVDA